MLYFISFKILGLHGHHENEHHDHLRHKFFRSNNHDHQEEEESKDPLWKMSITLSSK